MSKKLSRVEQAALEIAADMHQSGFMNADVYKKITLRHLGEQPAPEILPKDIVEIRTRAHLSQAVFAQRLNISRGQLSKLERGTERPKGRILVLFDVLRRKGVKVLKRDEREMAKE
jgi:putative transcriptional regulator